VDPESSPLGCLFGGCEPGGSILDGYGGLTITPPTPVDSLVPSILLGVAVIIGMNRDALGARLGMGETTHRVVVLGILFAAIAIAGIRVSNSLAYQLNEELGLGIDIVVAYGPSALLAAGLGYVAGLGILSWHESTVPRKPDPYFKAFPGAFPPGGVAAGAMPQEAKPDITLAEIAERPGLSTSTLRRHAASGKLGARRVDGRWVTTEEEFRRYTAHASK